ncbi:MAG: PHP domain-containing protein [Eubacteriaceae bacterium]|nr:PHP domain-containing protein [Eubacteriaceae bacterium]
MNMNGAADRDWHIHTYYSDGTLSPKEVIRWAKDQGLHEIAITDHDGVDGIPEAIEEGEKAGIRVIPGIELSTVMKDGTGLHILGYNIDWGNEHLLKGCEEMRRGRARRNKKLLEALAEEGFILGPEDIAESEERGFIGKPNIARAMVGKGYISDVSQAFSGIFSTKKMRAIKKKKIGTFEAIRLIKKAGGKPVLAHPGLIRHMGQRDSEEFFQNIDELLGVLRRKGLEGLECDYPEHTMEEKELFIEMAAFHGLDITKGSDFHGDGHNLEY